MKIGTNSLVTTAYNSFSMTNKAMEKTARALSTGLRAATAADDAAGFAIGMNISARIAGVNRAIRNSQDGISMLQTAEGGLNQINSMLQRMRELTVQAANDTLTTQDRNYIQMEIDELRQNVDNIAGNTTFNSKRLLDGSSAAIWTSDNDNTKLKVTGALTMIDKFGQKKTADGNYRIEIKATAGRAEVQKSSPMIIAHKDVAMDRSIDTSTGVNSLRISSLPAGHYTINDTPPTEARAVLTGSYGMDITELDGVLKTEVKDSKLTSNASILFEVVNTSDNAVTLRASARLLHTDGTTENISQEKIMLTENNSIDLSELLGVGSDEAFTMKLSGGAASSFKAGNKFVYNLNVAEGVEGADRQIGITGTSDTAVTELQKSNAFKPKEKITGSAKVLFLVDYSGSMQGPINQVRQNVSSFVKTIRDNENVDEVKIGVAGYLYHPVDPKTRQALSSSVTWSATETEAEEALTFNPSGGTVDAFMSIKEAVEILKDDMSDVPARYIVLVTDTFQENRYPTPEYPYGTYPTEQAFNQARQDAIDALKDAGISFSAIRPNSVYTRRDITRDQAIKDFKPIIEATGGEALNQSSGNWGTELSGKLAEKIADDAADKIMLSGTPLSQFEQFEEFFTGGNSVEIEIIQDGTSQTIKIESTDTLESLSQKLDDATGGSTKATFKDDEDGERNISLSTNLPEGSRVEFKGDKNFLNVLGMRSNLEQRYSLDADAVKGKNIRFRNFYIDSTSGQVYDTEITLSSDDTTELKEWSTHADFEASYVGQIPEYDVSLRDINTFYDSEGIYMFDRPQKITVTQGDGKQATITVYSEDTLEDLRRKLNDAIGEGLGQSLYADNKNNFVSFVREGYETSGGHEAVAGTFVIRSAIAGSAGRITLTSENNDLINALGLNTLTEAIDNTFTASIYDAHNGEVLASNVSTSGNTIQGIISSNLEIEFDSMANVKAFWNDKTKSYDMSADTEAYNTTIHISDKSTAFQVGARDGEDMFINIGDMRSESLGLNKVDVSTRARASESIAVLDAAVRKVSMQRTKIGAYQNELEYNYNSLTQTSLHLQESESRIKDADMAKEMMEFVKLQILSNTGSSMLSTANQNSQAVMNILNI